ncbi:YdiY family protein [Falsirhodobacter algicola]|uniref:DUF481 domain-containing protein n=1 Tax=Falsirhodobacter algicola TaxID=2692330 RepID=A0A8J8MRN1_9RHOB|nr:DUF481 domain-containing protein [Falsirhodobacter algicola]QUS34953.1 DUF481 domain-containing protein [Falsirhodobacter algicola]
MNNQMKIAGVSALALMLGAAAPTFAQTASDSIVNPNAIDDQIDQQRFDVEQQFDRSSDAFRYGAPGAREGFSGSASLGYSGATGNDESQNLDVGARVTHHQGPFTQNLSFLMRFEEEDSDATTEKVYGVYDGLYDINDRFYGFIMGRVVTDGLADEITDEDIDNGNLDIGDKVEQDAFLGIGPGYRIFNRPDLAWRVQAGVGQSYLKYGDGESDSEVGYVLSSRFYWDINQNVFITMDTDALNSDAALRVNNDLGVNFKVTDAFSTRISYLTDYNESRAIRTDNTLGVSLVYGF